MDEGTKGGEFPSVQLLKTEQLFRFQYSRSIPFRGTRVNCAGGKKSQNVTSNRERLNTSHSR